MGLFFFTYIILPIGLISYAIFIFNMHFFYKLLFCIAIFPQIIVQCDNIIKSKNNSVDSLWYLLIFDRIFCLQTCSSYCKIERILHMEEKRGQKNECKSKGNHLCSYWRNMLGIVRYRREAPFWYKGIECTMACDGKTYYWWAYYAAHCLFAEKREDFWCMEE